MIRVKGDLGRQVVFYPNVCRFCEENKPERKKRISRVVRFLFGITSSFKTFQLVSHIIQNIFIMENRHELQRSFDSHTMISQQ